MKHDLHVCYFFPHLDPEKPFEPKSLTDFAAVVIGFM